MMPAPGRLLAALTDREIQILKLLADGARTKEIAAALGVSVKTVESHKTALFSKIGADSAVSAVRWAMRTGHL